MHCFVLTFFPFDAGDAHVYNTHIVPLQAQLSREPKPFPSIRFKRSLEELLQAVESEASSNHTEHNGANGIAKADDDADDNAKHVRALEMMTEADILVEGYDCWPAIKMEMSV